MQVDFNGNTSFSPIRALDGSPFSGDIQVYPNPVKGVLHLILREQDAPLTIQLVNAAGITVFKESLSGNDSGHDLDCAPYSKGVYILKVQSSKGCFYQRLIIE